MRQSRLTFVLVAFLGPAHAIAGAVPRAPAIAASDHHTASACGAEVMERGGNAADAAVAMALCAGVVQPAGSGLGGGGFAVVVLPDGTATTLDFREVAPAAARRDMFLADPDASNVGGLAVAVPSESRGLAALLAAYGALTPAQVARPAIRLAARGEPAGTHLARAIARESSEAVKAELGEATAGQLLRRPELARTLRRWAATRGEDLHTGAGAAAIFEAVTAAGGVLTAADLAGVSVIERAPRTVGFRGHRVVTMDLPSAGGAVLAQVLSVLDPVDIEARGSAAYMHQLVEAMKHAYADRARLGDPGVPEVDVAPMLEPARLDAIRAAFDPERTLPSTAYGTWAPPPDDAGTQHLSALDADGMAVALTTTINTSFGSGVVVPSLGLILNDEMDDFTTQPGVPNAFGLVQGEQNVVRPGLRPLSSMTPTVILDADGRVRMVVGGSGGSTIISAVLQVVLGVLVHEVDVDEAVAAPRVHHQWMPELLFVEHGVSPDTRAALEARGHVLRAWPGFSAVQAIVRGSDGLAAGASDPRKGGRAVEAWPDGRPVAR